MKIEYNLKDRMTLGQFADKHGLVMEVTEREPSDIGKLFTEDLRYYAHFKNCDIKGQGVLIGSFGNGCNPSVAISNYAKEISGKVLVVDALSGNRREITVPIFST